MNPFDKLTKSKEHMAEMNTLIKDGKRIAAIKLVREVCHTGLRESKGFVDEYISSGAHERYLNTEIAKAHTKVELVGLMREGQAEMEARLTDANRARDALYNQREGLRRELDFESREKSALRNKVNELVTKSEEDDRQIDEMIEDIHGLKRDLEAEEKRNAHLSTTSLEDAKAMSDLTRKLKAMVEVIDHADEMVSLLGLNGYRRD